MKSLKNEEVSSSSSWVQEKGYRKKVLLDENDLQSRGVVLQVNIVEPNSTLVPHYHKKMTEAVFVLDGKASLIIAGENFPMKQGDLQTIQPNQLHTVKNSSNGEFKYLVLKTNFTKEDKYF